MASRWQKMLSLGGLLWATSGWTYTIDDLAIEAWAYSASASAQDYDGRSVCIFDFDAGPGGSYAFGYAWKSGDTFARPAEAEDYILRLISFGVPESTARNPSAALTEALLLNLAAQLPAVTLSYTYNVDMGMSVTGIAYLGNSSQTETLPDWSGGTYMSSWWDGFDSHSTYVYVEDPPGSGNWAWVLQPVPGEDPNGVFTYANLGVSNRGLADGYGDAFVLAGWGSMESYPIPDLPMATIPEPASLGLLGLALAALAMRRR